MEASDKSYIVIVQCHLVAQKCSGYFCEKAFNERSGGFSHYPADNRCRAFYLTCGGCCGRALHRKLGHLTRRSKAKEGISKEQIVVYLSSCITKDNYHGAPCPHLEYIKGLIAKIGLDVREDTAISTKAEALREKGTYMQESDKKRQLHFYSS